MELAQNIQQEIREGIKRREVSQGSFPFELNDGTFSHTIAKEPLESGHLLSTIKVEGKEYLIYLA